MNAQHITCNQCGMDAIVKRVDGIWNPSTNSSGIVLDIECPTCGEREQPEVSIAVLRYATNYCPTPAHPK
jgi:DNA-directed RNA polymerase subunit RPC12/RpoP